MSATRPKRHLTTGTPTRRSERIKESPVADYSPFSSTHRAASSHTRSRSKSRVLRDSHPFEVIEEDRTSQQPAKRRLEMNPRVKLDCQSDDEEQSPHLAGRLPVRFPGLRKTDSIDVLDVFGRLSSRQLPNYSVNGFFQNAWLTIKSIRVPTKSEVRTNLKTVTLPNLLKWSCYIFAVIILLSLFSSLIHSDNMLTLTATSVGSNIRMFFHSVPVPDFFNSGTEVIHGSSVDYDTLVVKILDSQKFKVLLEELSLQQGQGLEAKLQQNLQDEVNMMQLRTSQLDQRIMEHIREEMDIVKESVKQESEKVARESQSNMDNQKRLDTLSSDLDLLETKMFELEKTEDVNTAGDVGQFTHISTQIQTLRARLSTLETQLPDLQAEIQSCCNNKPDLKQELESRLDQIFGNMSSQVLEIGAASGFLTRADLEVDRQNIELQLTDIRENIIGKVKAETEKMASKLDSLVARVQAVRQDAQEPVSTITDISHGQGANQSEYVMQIVKQALDKYDADKTGQFDFALESAGGSIVSTRCTENYEGSSAVLSVMGVPIWWESNNPRTILQPGMAPGQCWAFRGSTGAVVVKLSATVLVKAVSIEHISLLSTPDGQISSAPKTMQLSGIIDGDNLIPLANFTYKKSGDPVQTFTIQTDQKLDTVELNIISNHGHPDYTCLYRFRVHGDPADEEKIH